MISLVLLSERHYVAMELE